MKTLLLFFTFFIYGFSNHLDMKLSSEEQAYFDTLKSIKICVKENYHPIEFIENDKIAGVTGAYLDLITKKTDLTFEPIITNTQEELLENIKNNRCSVVSTIQRNEETKDFLKFTSTYLSESLVVLRKAVNNDHLVDLYSLNNSMAVIKDNFAVEALRKSDNIFKITQEDSIYAVLDKIRKNEIYGLIDTQSVVAYNVKKRSFDDISVSQKIPFMVHYSMGVDKKEALLYSILQKTVLSIEPDKIQEFYASYLTKESKKEQLYETIVKLLFFLLSLILILIYLGLYFKEENKKRLEKEVLQIRKNRLAQMGEMTDVIAHQWRQPLSAISSTANNLIFKLLADQQIDKKLFLKEIELIESYTQHLSLTINDFRSFLDNQKELETVNINELLESVIEIAKRSFVNANILLKIQSNREITIEAYRSELKQVFLSLLQNAQDAIEEKEIQESLITIRVYFNDHDLVIKVSDNAGGIPNNIKEKIFEPNFTTKVKKGGTGVGLYISKSIIESHLEGKIIVKNEDKGASFFIILPMLRN